MCKCNIRHAITPDERTAAIVALVRAREASDKVGTILALASLDPCPWVSK